MAETIVVRVEIAEADYAKDFEVDPEEPLVKLLQKVAKEENIPLRKKSGHPLVWTAQGPDVREGFEGDWADLTRTQPLSRLSKKIIERFGTRSPLFSIRFDIPGAADAIGEKREEEKRAEIEARMAQREAERQAERAAAAAARADALGEVEQELVMDYQPPPDEVKTELAFEDEPETVLDSDRIRRARETAARAGAAAAGAAVVGAAAAGAAASGLEGRIKRRGSSGSGGASSGGKRKGGKAASSKGSKGSKGGAGKGKGKARGSGSGSGGAGGPLANLPPWALPAAGGGALLFVGLLVLLFSGGDEPEPTPEPTTPAPAVEDIEVATPEPTPPPPPKEEAPTPPPMEQFYSRGSFVHYQAKEVSAQLTSFAKTDVQLTWTANHAEPGISHGISLQGRFDLTFTDTGGTMNGKPFKAAVTPGQGTRITLRYDGSRLSVRVGGRSAGSWGVADGGGFPRWTLSMDPGVSVAGLRATAPVTE